MVIGVLLMLGAFWFWLSLGGNPFHELALIRHGETTSGFIIDAWEEPPDGGEGNRSWHYGLIYKYNTPDGREFTQRTVSWAGRIPEKLSLVPVEPYPVEIEYLPNKPEVSKIKGTGSNSIFDWLWRKIGLGGILLVGFLSIGFIVIQYTINEYRCTRMIFEIEHEMENSGDLTESQLMHKVDKLNRKIEKMHKIGRPDDQIIAPFLKIKEELRNRILVKEIKDLKPTDEQKQ